MLTINLNPKNLRKYSNNQSSKKLLPDSWSEFAPLTKIRSGASIVNFNPYNYQKTLIEQIEKHQTCVITKSRQLGITEVITNYFLFKACKNPGYLAVIFSKSQADTSNIAKRIRRQLESLYEYVEPDTDSLQDIQISNGGRILFRNSTPNGSRGLESVSDILFDEAAFVPDIEEIYKSAIPCTTTVGQDAKIIILSTPNGQSGWYWDKLTANNNHDILEVCNNIKSEIIGSTQYWTDNNGWLKFVTHWLAHPKFSQDKDNYLSNIKKQFELPIEVVEQEYNLSFTDTQTNVFNSSLIKDVCIGSYSEHYESEDKSVYYCGLDTSLLGSDYTVFTVLKEVDNKYHLVKMYRKRKETHEFHIYNLSEIITEYSPVKVGIEVNSSGQIYFERLSSDNLNTEFIPIKTTSSSKPVLINRLILALERGLLVLPSDKIIIQEFLSFKQTGNKLEASLNKHDDIIISLAMAVNCLPIWK